ncbi:MAG TPA: folylpolyglutamate synthase/dihydrofolate synthase family protein [Thermoanaerobaculia bacterium]|nr:folylpolyglutamate synthase/dihydrofolate synthase family protein [Thermoanaerobaculia bacterium]
MRILLRALGNPHRAYPSIIVAGTNGKGSTCAALTSILDASGYRTGLYTSPHLVDLHERWTIGGSPIDQELLDECIVRLHEAAGEVGIAPTYFEALTLIAFIAFARARCEIVVLEVGMGGRLDATNVVRPIGALITPIGVDHTEYLGNTIRKIAAEKAGVIHRGALALTSNTDPDVIDVLRRRAAKFGGRLRLVRTEHSSPLAGDFQRMNAALAAEAAAALRKRLPRITDDAIEIGIARTQWRGRLERMMVRGKEVWVDGCHNTHAARVIAPFIEKAIAKPRTLVFGIMSDKNIREVAAVLFPLFEHVIATEPYPPRSEAAASLAAMARETGITAEAIPDPRAAIKRALRSAPGPVFVGGSLYLAGAAVEFLDQLRARDQ